MRTTLIIILFIFCFSCEQKSELPKLQKREAGVDKVQGLYIFILSEPKLDYEPLGEIRNNIGEQLGDATDGKKKFGDIVEGIFSTAANNADFQKLLNHMATRARETYPNADGILFKFNMSQGTVIKFKE